MELSFLIFKILGLVRVYLLSTVAVHKLLGKRPNGYNKSAY